MVSDETAMLHCTDKGRMRRNLDLLQKRRGIAVAEAPSAQCAGATGLC